MSVLPLVLPALQHCLVYFDHLLLLLLPQGFVVRPFSSSAFISPHPSRAEQHTCKARRPLSQSSRSSPSFKTPKPAHFVYSIVYLVPAVGLVAFLLVFFFWVRVRRHFVHPIGFRNNSKENQNQKETECVKTHYLTFLVFECCRPNEI